MMSALTGSYEPSWRTRYFTRAVDIVGAKLNYVEKGSVNVCEQCMDSCKQQLKLFEGIIKEIKSYSRDEFTIIEEDLEQLRAVVDCIFRSMIKRA